MQARESEISLFSFTMLLLIISPLNVAHNSLNCPAKVILESCDSKGGKYVGGLFGFVIGPLLSG